MRHPASSSDPFRDATKMGSHLSRSHAFATMVNFATVQPASRRYVVDSESQASPRFHLLHFLQQLDAPPSVVIKFRITAAPFDYGVRCPGTAFPSVPRLALVCAQPSPVEVHFDEAVIKAKQLAQPKKKSGKQTEGGK